MTKDEIYTAARETEAYIKHWGVKGQRWGLRRYQNPDGTLTEEGKKHYGVLDKRQTRVVNDYNAMAARNAQKAQNARNSGNEQKEKKALVRALSSAELAGNKKFIETEAENRRVANKRLAAGAFLLGPIVGSIVSQAIPNKNREESIKMYTDTLNKYGNMKIEELEQRFSKEIASVQKRNTSHKEYNSVY